MRLPAQMDGVYSVLGMLLSWAIDSARDRQLFCSSSAPSRHSSRTTIQHAVIRLLAGGLLFLAASAVHATPCLGCGSAANAVSDGAKQIQQQVGRSSTYVVSKLSTVNYVGGYLATGYLSSPMFGSTYGATTEAPDQEAPGQSP